MHRQRLTGLGSTGLGTVLAAAVTFASGCDSAPLEVRSGEMQEPRDGAFTALQTRGQQAMGVDQYTSTHVFDALADGGRIGLQRNVDDPAGIDEIRRHIARIGEAFASGDFSTPRFVHLREVPGTAVMAAKKDLIDYVYRDLLRGAELRLVTNDPEALRAIHDFMAFQREQHRAGGIRHEIRDHSTMHQGLIDRKAVSHAKHLPR